MNLETLPPRIPASMVCNSTGIMRRLKYIFKYETYYMGRAIRSLELKIGFSDGCGEDLEPSCKHFLYRHYDLNGTLLYVGVSLNALSRLSQHKRSSAWFHKIESVKIEKCKSREDSLKKEREAIENERPIYNIFYSLKNNES